MPSETVTKLSELGRIPFFLPIELLYLASFSNSSKPANALVSRLALKWGVHMRKLFGCLTSHPLLWPQWWGARQSSLPGDAPWVPGLGHSPPRCSAWSSGPLAGLGAVFHVRNPAEPIWYKFMLIPRPPPFTGLFREPEKSPL